MKDYNRVGVFATEATVKSGKYSQELKKYNPNIVVKEMASKNWVGIVENNIQNINEAKANIKNEIEEMLSFKPEKVILGCTHYPYLMDEFKKYSSQELFIDPAKVFVNFIKNDLENRKLLNLNNQLGKEDFYVSSNPSEFVKNAKIFYDVKTLPTLI